MSRVEVALYGRCMRCGTQKPARHRDALRDGPGQPYVCDNGHAWEDCRMYHRMVLR